MKRNRRVLKQVAGLEKKIDAFSSALKEVDGSFLTLLSVRDKLKAKGIDMDLSNFLAAYKKYLLSAKAQVAAEKDRIAQITASVRST